MSALQLNNDLVRPEPSPGLTGAEAKMLAAALRRAERRDRLRSLLLAAPLLLLLTLSFALPIVLLLSRAVYDPTVADALPRTSRVLGDWDGMGVPGDAAFAALGVAVGAEGPLVRLPAKRALFEATAAFSFAVAAYARTLAIGVDEAVPEEPERFRAALASVDTYKIVGRSRAGL